MQQPSSDPPKAVEVIARGVARRGDLILLCRDRRRGYTYLPGGHVEPGESAADACRREFAEETGLTTTPGPLLLVAEMRFTQNGRRRHELNLVFHVEHAEAAGWPEFVPSLEDKIEFIWVPLAALGDHDFRPRALEAWLAEHDDRAGEIAWISSSE